MIRENVTMNKLVEQIVAEIINKPCMSPKCEEYLKSFITENRVLGVLEFGSGGSTKMFAELGCYVMTVESALEYYLAIRNVCSEYKYVYPILAMDESAYLIASLLSFNAEVVFIDGKWRDQLLRIFQETELPWEYVMIHDSEREEYQAGIEKLREVAEDLSPVGINLAVFRNKKFKR